MALPTSKQESTYEALDEGTYEVTLKAIYLSPERAYQSDSFNNGDGLRYQAGALTWDVDGTEWIERFVRISLAGNSKFFNRLSALVGRDIVGGDEGDKVDWGLAADAEKTLPIDDYYQLDKDDPELGKKGTYVFKETTFDGVKGNVKSLKVNDDEMLGRSCLLKIDKKANGYNAAKQGAASPLPKKNTRKPTPVTAEAPAGIPV